MLKTALFDSLPKDVEVNSRKVVLDGPDFNISSILDFAIVIIYVIIWYQICFNHIYFFYWNPHAWNLGLDTKITFLLQLEQKLWHIYWN